MKVCFINPPVQGRIRQVLSGVEKPFYWAQRRSVLPALADLCGLCC